MPSEFAGAKDLHQLLRMLDEQHATDYRRYSEVSLFIGMKAREKDIPVSGFFELTPLCNLDCKMCYVRLNREQMGKAEILSAETWIRLIDEAIDAGMLYASLSGGECLTHPGFAEIYTHLAERGIRTVIYSNGTLLQDDVLELFRKYPPTAVSISLYGASEEAYERVTGHRCFERVVRNMTTVKSMKVGLNITVTPSVYMTDAADILRFLHENGFSFYVNPALLPPRTETGRDLADTDTDAYIALFRLARELNGEIVQDGCDPDGSPLLTDHEAPAGLKCGGGRSSFAITWDGMMHPCANFDMIRADTLSLGFSEAWKTINDAVKEFPRPAECEACPNKCRYSSCVLYHLADAQPGHASEKMCSLCRKMIMNGLKSIEKQ